MSGLSKIIFQGPDEPDDTAQRLAKADRSEARQEKRALDDRKQRATRPAALGRRLLAGDGAGAFAIKNTAE